jgi:AbrB family looped-hinge helix DNA binding protein
MSRAITMTHRVRFSTRGRVTIPATLRRKHGIRSGSRLACDVTPLGIVLKSMAAKRR